MKSLVYKSNLAFGLIILVYLVYASIFIFQTSVFMEGKRYFVLFDDAMISMQYAKNLAQGNGLVWNAGGERIEGFTNPLWVLYMALFHLLPVPLNYMGLFIQISGALFLALNLFFVKQITGELASGFFAPLLAILLTAFYYPLNNWGLQGMEVSILALLLTTVIWQTWLSLQRERFFLWPYLLLGLGTLIRIDMAAPYLAILGYMIIADRPNRIKHLSWGFGLLAVFLLSQTLFRLWYYGDILPNTYYLKMTGYPLVSRVSRGLYVFFKLLWNFNWILFLLPFSIILFRRDRLILLLLTVLVFQIGYSIYVGGDAWEHRGGANRYISIAMPAFFILFVLTAVDIKQRLVQSFVLKNSRPAALYTAANLGLAIFIIASLINANSLLDTGDLKKLFLHLDINKSSARYVQIAHILDDITLPGAKVAVVTAGVIPYFTNNYYVDLLGKNDRHIAHGPSAVPTSVTDVEGFRPGHSKWDYAYSIGKLQPDVLAQWWEGFDAALPYLEGKYTRIDFFGIHMYLRNDSPGIRWDQVEKFGVPAEAPTQ